MIRRAFVVLLVAAACARPAPVTTAPAPAPAPAEQPRSPQRPHPVPVPVHGPRMTAPLPPAAAVGAIHWWRNSAERTVLFLQTYRWAGERLRELAAREPRGSWAVIMDADETVLDNSTYQFRRNPQGEGYSAESWTAWVNEEAAPATPGAPEFTRLVHELGGRVAIVTTATTPPARRRATTCAGWPSPSTWCCAGCRGAATRTRASSRCARAPAPGCRR
ncbi:MAG TPA: HAD family acid phosphatase [Longimicrobium sp.]|jgi:5'-nucleotidase (lipoprotein e(P4) family)